MPIMKYFYKIFAVLSLFIAIFSIFTGFFLLVLLCGGAALYLWVLSNDNPSFKDDIKKILSGITRGLYYICLIISGLILIGYSIILYSILTTGNSILTIGNSTQSDLFWPIIFILEFILFFFYFVTKLFGTPHILRVNVEENGIIKHFPSTTIFLFGIFLILLILSLTYLTFSGFGFNVINPPNDGRCDYDNSYAIASLRIIQIIPSTGSLSENTNKNIHEFCADHLMYYTLINPFYIISATEENPIIGYFGLEIKSWAKLGILLWGILLLYVLFSIFKFLRFKKENVVSTSHFNKKFTKQLILGMLAGFSIFYTFYWIIELIEKVSFVMTDYRLYEYYIYKMPSPEWILINSLIGFLLFALPSITFLVCIFQDSRNFR